MTDPHSNQSGRLSAFITRGWARWVALAALVALIIGAVFGVTMYAQAQAANSPDGVSIRSVGYAGLVAQQTVIIPPASYQGGPMSDAMQQAMLAHADQTFRLYYTDPQLTYEISTYQTAIQNEQSGDSARILGGGADHFVVTQLSVNGATATLAALAIIWLSSSQVNSMGRSVVATPRNSVVATFTLVRINGHWLISAQRVRFASGSGP